MVYQPGVAGGDDLKVQMVWEPQEGGWPAYIPYMHRGWYFLTPGEPGGRGITDTIDDPIYDENEDRIYAEGGALSVPNLEHYLYGAPPDAAPISVSTTEATNLYLLGFAEPVATMTPIVVTETDNAERVFTQLATVMHVETVTVMQNAQGVPIVVPAYAALGTMVIISITNSDDPTATVVDDYTDGNPYITITSGADVGARLSLTYMVIDTYAITDHGEMFCVLPAEIATVALAVQYQEDTDQRLWRSTEANLYPAVSGFRGGFLFVDINDTTPSALAFSGTLPTGTWYSATPTTGPFFQPITLEVLCTDEIGNPAAGAALTWEYRLTHVDLSVDEWAPITGNLVYLMAATDLAGIGVGLLSGEFVLSLLEEGEYTPATNTFDTHSGIEVRVTSGIYSVIANMPFTRTAPRALTTYLQSSHQRVLSQGVLGYRLSAWVDTALTRGASPGSYVIFSYIANGSPTVLGTVDCSTTFPYLATLHTYIRPGDQWYASLYDDGDALVCSSSLNVI